MIKPTKRTALYALAALPACTDLLETHAIPNGVMGWTTEVVIGLLLIGLVYRMNKQFARLVTLVRLDPITGLGNRRAFDEDCTRECKRADRLEQDLMLLYIDIDDFKEINDSFSHTEGDRVLRTLARILQVTSRNGVDSCYRIGGDEFTVLLPGLDVAGAENFAHRLSATVRDFVSADLYCTFTISAGWAAFRSGDDAANLLHRADLHMYVAKHERATANSKLRETQRESA